MPRHRLFLARFPYQNQECPDSADWCFKTITEAREDPRIDEVLSKRFDDTPITMTRNLAVEQAKAVHADLLLMVDSDMKPDLPGEEPFFKTALDFMLAHQHAPCLVAAPYGGPPPLSLPYVFRWTNHVNGHPPMDPRFIKGLEMYTREEAACMRQTKEAAALATGLILIDMRVFEKMTPPYFYYEWSDHTQSVKGSTEDVTFTRDASLAGCPCYCAWGCWAGHWKRWMADRPQILRSENVGRALREAFLKDTEGTKPREQLLQVSRTGRGHRPLEVS